MKIEKTRFHHIWLSNQAFFIPCHYTKVLVGMQSDTKNSTLSTDEVATTVMTYLDFSSQQSVEVTVYTGASYTCKPFKCYYVGMIYEVCTTKLIDISTGMKT